MNDFTDSELEDRPTDYPSLLADALTAGVVTALCAVICIAIVGAVLVWVTR
jgi:hypothetical protein